MKNKYTEVLKEYFDFIFDTLLIDVDKDRKM